METRAAKARSKSSGSDPQTAAWERAVRFLAARDYTERDLRMRLEDAGLPAGAIDAAVSRLLAAGYLDDAAVAVRIAERRVRGGFGSERIRAELTAHGVSEDLQTAACAVAVADEEARARTLLTRRRLDGGDKRACARAARFLRGRGFPVNVVCAVIGKESCDF
ncbi:recombination regulator RecX [Candidatus Binatia bacterium]|nr:recombination regulator RecX [Candidatus Binatia bacterium]